MAGPRSLFDALRPSRRRQPDASAIADEALDAALTHLADACEAHEKATDDLRCRKESGKLKIVSLSPPESVSGG